MPIRYAEWLQNVFDSGADRPEFDAQDENIVELVTETLARCGADLAPYTDAQVAQGLDHLFHPACGDVVFSLMARSVPEAKRLRALSAVKILYRDCLAPRCAPVLGHTNQPGGGPLNTLCYMLWDTSPLIGADPATVIDVLAFALTSPNPAVVESGLHGLGHLHADCPKPVEAAIATYERQASARHPQLRAYARQAAHGQVP